MIRECEEHGYFRNEVCPFCGEEGKFIMSDFEVEKVGRMLAGILRHGKFGLRMDSEGYVSTRDVMDKVRERNPRMDWMRIRHLEALVDTDPKGRYVISGKMIKATYGHTIDLDFRLDCENIPDELFYPTNEDEVQGLLENGIQPSGRTMVHLSKTFADAMSAGKVHTEDPIILGIDTDVCMDDGYDIGRAARTVYLCHEVPPDAIFVADPDEYESEAQEEQD